MDDAKEIIEEEITDYFDNPFSKMKRIDEKIGKGGMRYEIIGRDNIGREIMLSEYRDDKTSVLQIAVDDSKCEVPLEDYGIKVHSYLEKLKGIIKDEEFIELLAKGYVHLKLIKDEGRERAIIYVPYTYACNFHECKIFYSPADFISFLEDKLYPSPKIRKKSNDVEDVSNIELFNNIYVRISTSFSQDGKFTELNNIDKKLENIQENYINGQIEQSEKAYSLSRNGLRKYKGYKSKDLREDLFYRPSADHDNVLFVNILIGGNEDYTYLPVTVKEINESNGNIEVKVISPSYYPLSLERIITEDRISDNALSFFEKYYKK
ncbi:hypothetical protein YN1_8240 [Nanoarchaeota archaeon]